MEGEQAEEYGEQGAKRKAGGGPPPGRKGKGEGQARSILMRGPTVGVSGCPRLPAFRTNCEAGDGFSTPRGSRRGLGHSPVRAYIAGMSDAVWIFCCSDSYGDRPGCEEVSGEAPDLTPMREPPRAFARAHTQPDGAGVSGGLPGWSPRLLWCQNTCWDVSRGEGSSATRGGRQRLGTPPRSWTDRGDVSGSLPI